MFRLGIDQTVHIYISKRAILYLYPIFLLIGLVLFVSGKGVETTWFSRVFFSIILSGPIVFAALIRPMYGLGIFVMSIFQLRLFIAHQLIMNSTLEILCIVISGVFFIRRRVGREIPGMEIAVLFVSIFIIQSLRASDLQIAFTRFAGLIGTFFAFYVIARRLSADDGESLIYSYSVGVTMSCVYLLTLYFRSDGGRMGWMLFINPNNVGMHAAFATIGLLWLMIKRRFQIFDCVSFLLLVLALVTSGSRQFVIATLLGTVTLVLGQARILSLRKKIVIAIAFAVFAVSGVVIVSEAYNVFGNVFLSKAEPQIDKRNVLFHLIKGFRGETFDEFMLYSSATRYLVYREGLEAFLENPLTGLGVGNFTDAVLAFTMSGEEITAHSVYLSVAVELGILGLITLLVWHLVIVRKCIQTRGGFSLAISLMFILAYLVGGRYPEVESSLVWALALSCRGLKYY
jgi:O-antigen ligase